MPLASEFKTMASDKITEAKVLCNGGQHQGAFYIAGYALEFSLKAVVCKCLDMPDFFNDKTKNVPGYISGDIRSKYKTHDVKTLIVLAGLYNKIESDKTTDSDFGLAWYHIESLGWSEKCRYETVGHTAVDIEKFIEFIET